MKLKELNSVDVCEAFKQGLLNHFSRSGVINNPIKDIYTITNPQQNLPDNYITIMPNGSMDNRGYVAQGIILMEIYCKLLPDGSINKVKNNKVLEWLGAMLDNDVIVREGYNNDVYVNRYYFSYSADYAFIDDINVEFGYSVKRLNIFFRKKTKHN